MSQPHDPTNPMHVNMEVRVPDHNGTLSRPLRNKEVRFVEEYLYDMDAPKAAKRAGFKTFNVAGEAMLMDWRVQKLIAERIAQRSERTGIRADRVLQELEHAAFFDPMDYVTHAIVKPADIAELPPHVRRHIAGWKWDAAGNFTIQFRDKDKALELIGRHLGLFKDVLEVNTTNMAQEMDLAKARVRKAKAAALEGVYSVADDDDERASA